MGWLMDTYLSGDHARAWRALDQGWVDGIDFDMPWDVFPDEEETDALMTETFGRVARNIDRLIEGLRAVGYRFECEAGRTHAKYAPRQPFNKDDETRITTALTARFDGFPCLEGASPTLPRAITAFASIVGDVDLRQRFAAQDWEITDPAALDPDEIEGDDDFKTLLKAIQKSLPGRTAAEQAHIEEIHRQDLLPHPFAEDSVLARLGDWDPFCFDFGAIAASVTEEEAEMGLIPSGGLGLMAEWAPAFEHKANVSGAVNPLFYLPNTTFDPVIFAEGIRMTFTTYLRLIFERGGFFGVPRPVRRDGPEVITLPGGMLRPDHPVFTELARDFEPF